MKWKNKAKKTATTTSAILLAIMLTACSDQNNNIVPSNNTQEEQTDVGSIPSTTLPDETGELDPGSISGDNNSNEDNDIDTPNNNSGSNDGQTATDDFTKSDVISAKGIYIGAADNHTIEIEVDGTYISLQVEEDLQYIINDYPSDKPVAFEYVKKTSKELGITQNWLTSITLE